jgi:hypothetical protein
MVVSEEEIMKAFQKAQSIIQTCETRGHFTFTESYLKLFKKRFNNQDKYDQLFSLLITKKNNHGFC